MARHYESKPKGKGGMMDRHAHKMQQLGEGEEYAGAADKNRHRFEDNEMIYEDDRAIANLPQSVEIKTYPRINAYMPGDLDDGMSGIDSQMMENASMTRKHLKPRKA